MFTGNEQIHNPSLSRLEKAYVFLFGMPIIGLRVRCRNILALVPQKTYHHILDAGSGSGVLCFALARRFPKARLTGLDLDPEAVGISRAIASAINRPHMNFRHQDIKTLNDKNQYDLIVCVDILEHIENDAKALNNLYHALNPGGTLVLHVPALYRRYPILKKRLNFDVPTHVRCGYDKEAFEGLVRSCQFTIQQSGYTYGIFETLANNLSYMITKAKKQNRLAYAFAFPLLNLISLMGRCARPEKLGAGIFIVATKGDK